MPADISVEDDIASMAAQTVETFGGLNFAFSNAGLLLKSGPIAEVTTDTVDRILAVNVRGVALCMKHEIPAMARPWKPP